MIDLFRYNLLIFESFAVIALDDGLRTHPVFVVIGDDDLGSGTVSERYLAYDSRAVIHDKDGRTVRPQVIVVLLDERDFHTAALEVGSYHIEGVAFVGEHLEIDISIGPPAADGNGGYGERFAMMSVQRRQFEGFAQTHRLLVHHSNHRIRFLLLFLLLANERDIDSENDETDDRGNHAGEEAYDADGPVFSFGCHRQEEKESFS